MVAPPFLPDESVPADNGIVSQFPAQERVFRDTVESWLLIDHNTSGQHPQVTVPERASKPTQTANVGFLYTKDVSGVTELFYEDSAGNEVQISSGGAVNQAGVLDAPTGTALPFYNSAAPTGWTKDTAGTLNDHAMRIVTSTAWAGGSNGTVAFSTVFAQSTTQGHLLTAAESGLPVHSHGPTLMVRFVGSGGIFVSPAAGPHYTHVSIDNAGGTNASSAHSHNMDIRVKYANFILATKD